jgi:hypothetical protein
MFLETLGSVYHNDALARERELSPKDRLDFHQDHSAPLMKETKGMDEGATGRT